jgi:hypothetical protein
MIKNAMQSSLSKDYDARMKWHTNRASAVFPVLIRKGCDVRILALNYWRIKNNIQNVSATYRLYSQSGELINIIAEKIINDHNDFSVNSMLTVDDFDGMIEVEYSSDDNLKYAFPGITVVYEANGCVSAVHSSGRVKNANEAYQSGTSQESNWSCNFSDNITPFFHVFNGQRALSEPVEIDIELRDSKNNIINKKNKYITSCQGSFSSQIIYLDEVFGSITQKGELFCIARVPSGLVFPRMACGNYHKKEKFLEVTHSFPVIKIKDYLPKPSKENSAYSAAVYLQPELLSLSAVSFPTNSESNLVAKCINGKDVKWNSGKDLFEADLGDKELTRFEFNKENIPSRLNTSLRYSVKNSNSMFSTDIATGVSAWISPEKFNHWGYGLLSKDFETVILLANVNLCDLKNANMNGELSIFFSSGKKQKIVSKDIHIGQNGYSFIYVSNLIDDFKYANTTKSISWYLSMQQSGAQSYWLSFAKDGRICGDHGL